MTAATTPILAARGLTKRFQGLVSVDRVDLSLPHGEILALIGPNGAGKTTLINLISGTLRADAGELSFAGKPIGGLPSFRRARLGIARTFQVMKPFHGLTALENVTVAALFGGDGGDRSPAAARQAAMRWLTFTGLGKRADQPAEALGGPDRKRLELAKALAQRPKLLLLDEVMAGLHAVEVDEVIELVKAIRNEGVTILIVEHVMKAVHGLADRVIVLHHGQAIAEGNPATVFDDPRVREAYLGAKAALSPTGHTASAGTGEPLLRIAGVSAGYGRAPVLFDVDLVVRPGEIVALVGNNGAGKTTLLRAVSRVIAATGAIAFDGEDLPPTPEQVFARGLVQVPEGRQLFGRMTIEENLQIGASKRSDRAAVARSFDLVYGLFPVLGKRRHALAGNLSGGEQQMCAIGRALMAAPRLLMIDEMSLGLAPVVVDQLLAVLDRIRQEGIAVLLVEQNVSAAFSVADRGYVMETGEIVREGRARALAEDPAVRAAYLGVEAGS